MSAGLKPLIIPVFLPHQGCPHRCVFCNQYRITGTAGPLPTAGGLKARIDRFLALGSKARRGAQIAFYGGNFLGQPPRRIARLLEVAAGYVQSGRVQGIRFSTRPDSVTVDRMDGLKRYPVTDVELGVQSMDDAVLQRSRRGHTAEQTREAARRIKAAGFRLGLQMMTGLPAETEASCFATARQMADLTPDYVRIYPTLVLADSPLAAWLQAGTYRPLTLDEALDRVRELALYFFKRDIAVIRMGLPAELGSDGLLAGPRHPALGHRVHSRLFLAMARILLGDGRPRSGSVAFRVHPSSFSKLQGHGGENLIELKRRQGIAEVRITADPSVPPDGLQLEGRAGSIRYRDLTSRVEESAFASLKGPEKSPATESVQVR